MSFASETVTIIRRQQTGTDQYGEPVYEWQDDHQVGYCLFQPADGSEDRSLTGDVVTKRWVLDAPFDADIKSTDRVKRNGTVYQVQGYVQRWTSPTGWLNHLRVKLERVESE
jgi:head-tail adaptor